MKQRYDYLLELVTARKCRLGCEIGLWYGRTFFHLLDHVPGLLLFGVDIWAPCNASHDTDQAANRRDVYFRAATRSGARIIEAESIQAANVFLPSSLDFVFIDADHAEESVRADIAAWRGKIRPGGLICGDDYDIPGVRAAVDSLIPAAAIEGGFFWWKELG